MNKNKKFSIIITVYKNFNFISESLSSIFSQVYKNYDLIIIDSFFSLKRKKFIKNLCFKNKISFLYKTYNNKFKSSGARNLGACFAQGEYLAFLDDDDIWNSKYLYFANKKLNEVSPDLLITQFVNVNIYKETLKKNYLPKRFNIHDLYLFNPGVLPSNTIIKRKTFEMIGGFNTQLIPSSDKIILIDIIKKKFTYQVLKHFLVLRRQHGSQWTKDYSYVLKSFLQFYKYYKDDFILIIKFRYFLKLVILFIKSKIKISK